ncbi:MAG: hypothetical protein QM767_28065 [Anaeromyxobacter sp.]
MLFHQCFGDGHSQAKPAELTRDLRVGLFEGLEDFAEEIGVDPDPVVVERNPQPTWSPLAIGGQHLGEHLDAAVDGTEFAGVADLPEDLLDAGGVGEDG